MNAMTLEGMEMICEKFCKLYDINNLKGQAIIIMIS